VTCGISANTCCTPDTIRAVTSSITTCLGTCITGAAQSYKLAGTTAVNRTIDLEQLAVASCTWRADVSADHVLTRATKHTLDTLVYEMERTANDTWTARVYARNSGDTQRVWFFSGTVNTGTGITRCDVTATANNGQTSCDLTATPKRGGHSGTFAKPVTVGGGTDCANCMTLTTPSSFSATIASVTTCVDQCDGNRWRLTGNTAVNRSITISQVGGSPCLLRGTVSANYVLYDHDTAAATWNIDTIRYELVRTGATTATWNITGRSSGTQRVVYATGTSSVSANDCKTWGTSTHTNPGCSADSAADTVVAGTAGSTTLTSCPA
jgi:hypothetical protein